MATNRYSRTQLRGSLSTPTVVRDVLIRGGLYTFNSVEEMHAWLAITANRNSLLKGDHLHVGDDTTPDYWWDGSGIVPYKSGSAEGAASISLFSNMEDLEVPGDANNLYISERTNEMYRWCEEDNNYKCISVTNIPVEHYMHEQKVASDNWKIIHNLNSYPTVAVVDTTNTLIVGEVIYENTNELTIQFSGAVAGKACLR